VLFFLILFFFFCFLIFWNRVFLCILGWSGTHNPPASVLLLPGLQMCIIMPGFRCLSQPIVMTSIKTNRIHTYFIWSRKSRGNINSTLQFFVSGQWPPSGDQEAHKPKRSGCGNWCAFWWRCLFDYTKSSKGNFPRVLWEGMHDSFIHLSETSHSGSFFFFFFWWDCGLILGLYTYKAGTFFF
jgi:hypothetical protein